MSRQIALRYCEPSPAVLEGRIRILEIKMAGLTETVALLVRALEDGPKAGLEEETIAAAAAKAGRKAHETRIKSGAQSKRRDPAAGARRVNGADADPAVAAHSGR